MNVFELFAKISVDTSGYEKGLDDAAKQGKTAQSKMKGLGTAVGNLGKTFTKMGATATAVGGGIFAFANKVSKNADEIDKMSQKLGISAQAYQEWDFILEHCGANVEGLQASMKTLANAAADGSDSTTEAFSKLGLKMEDVQKMSQEDLFATVISRLQDMGESTERTAVAADLLGRSATELGPVFNMSSKETEEMRKQLHDLGAVMSDEAVKQGAAFQDSMTNLKKSFAGVTNGLAKDLIPKITELMDKFSKFVADGGLKKVADIFKKLAPLIAAVGAAIVGAKIAKGISDIITAFKELGGAIGTIKTGFKALTATLAANPFVAVVTIIAALVAGFIALYKNSETFREGIKKVGEFFKGVFEEAVQIVEGFIESWVIGFNSIMGTAQSVLESVKQFFINAWENIKAVWDTVTGFFQSLWENIKNAFAAVQSFFTSIFTAALNGVKNVWNTITGFFSQIWEGIKAVFNAYINFIGNFFQRELQIVKTAWNTVTSFFSGIWAGIKSIFSNVAGTLGGYFSSAWAAIKSAFSTVGDYFSGVWSTIKSAFNVSDALNWGKDLINNFIDGIKNAWNSLKDTVSDIAGTVADYLGFSEPKLGPLSNFHTYAPDMMQLFAQGVKDNAGLVQKQLDSSLNFDYGTANIDFNSSGLGAAAASAAAQAATAGGNGSAATAPQPVTIVVQLASGLEIARQMVDDINTLNRISGTALI